MKTTTFFGEAVGDAEVLRPFAGDPLRVGARGYLGRRDDPGAMRIRRYGMIPTLAKGSA